MITMKKLQPLLLFLLLLLIAQANLLKAQTKPLTKEEKVYALSLLWKELHYNFPYYERLKQANIDSLYLAYIPKIEKAEGYEYYRTLMAFLAHFNDVHTALFKMPPMIDWPQLGTMIVDKKIIIRNTPKSMVDKVPIGSEIIKINTIPIAQYLRDSVYPYVAAATPHAKQLTAMNFFLENGVTNSFLDITIKKTNGEEADVRLVRNYKATGGEEWAMPPNLRKRQPINIEVVGDSIGWIQLNSCWYSYVDTISAVFYRNLPMLRKCKGIILDLRYNGGGTEVAWQPIGHHLLLEPTYNMHASILTREHLANSKARGMFCDTLLIKGTGIRPYFSSHYDAYYKGIAMKKQQDEKRPNPVKNSQKLRQPLVVLTGHATKSAAEYFVLALEGEKRGVTIGTPTAGSLGQVLFVALPGEAYAMMVSQQCLSSDGIDYNTTGIPPDIYVEQDLSYLDGKDNVLERAIEELNKQIAEK